MSRRSKELSPLEISRLASAGYHHVGGVAGLVLQISSRGTKSWLLRVMVGGKRREIGLGGYPDVTVAGAREAAREYRKLIATGIDPVASRAEAKSKLAAAIASSITFEAAAGKYIEANEPGWKNSKHAAQWTSTLATYAYPKIGALLLDHIETSHIVAILEPIWATKTETASRVRGRIEKVIDWAKVRGHRKGENPARWKGHLDQILPAPSKVKDVQHHAALPYIQINAFVSQLQTLGTVTARALELTILTALRTEAVINADWSEIDLSKKIWTVPKVRMKGDKNKVKDFQCPLSDRAIEILIQTPEAKRIGFIFPGRKRNSGLSNMAMLELIADMNNARSANEQPSWVDPKENDREITVHGFRSTFRDWAADITHYQNHIVEMALQHVVSGEVEAAYRRGELLAKRTALMQDWADYIAMVTSENVIPLLAKEAS